MKSILPIFLQIILFILCDAKYKKPRPIVETKQSAKFDNPNYIRDRFKDEIYKPQMPDEFKNRYSKPFNPAWMDYCDPYHCNDYHKTACGLNRKTMRFRWFQSGCHIVLNNQCASYRGSLKYDPVDTNFCVLYVMYLRTGCPSVCDKHDDTRPLCALNTTSNEVVIFKSKCAMDMVNCRKDIQEYEEVDMSLCEYYVILQSIGKELLKIN